MDAIKPKDNASETSRNTQTRMTVRPAVQKAVEVETSANGDAAVDLELQDQLTEQLRFAKPSPDTVMDSVPRPPSRFEFNLQEILTGPKVFDLSDSMLDDVRYRFDGETSLAKYFTMRAAERAIEAKAAALGWVGAITADIESIGSSGYVIRYEHADIYYSPATGAHVVLGDIRAKYNALNGANGVLGLPLTDETVTPDGIGRYNHFQGGSIYWTPNTGPMMVRGAIRDLWASQGWELGAMGYPVCDPDYKVIADPINKPAEYSSVFQNGAIYSKGNVAAPALVAELLPHQLTHLIRKTFDEALKQANSDLGIDGGAHILNITNWGYGFWSSQKRMITYEINGFHNNGLLPDTTFRLELQFQFGLTWGSTFTEPVDKTLTIYLKRWKISTSGLGHGTLLDGLKNGLISKFPFAVQTIPAAALLIDILITPQGGMQFLLEPDTGFPPIGVFRRNLFQNQLNVLVEE